MRSNFIKRNFDTRVLLFMAVTAVLITIFGVMFGQDFWMILPLYVSLVISLLQSSINRMAPLVGGLNSILYAAVYFSYGLYASSVYALFLSCPMQIAAFVNWNKRKSGSTVKLRSLTAKQRIFIIALFCVCWLGVYAVLSLVGSSYLLLDNTTTLLGILTTVLMMLAYIEYLPLMILGNSCTICLYIAMLGENPEQITYLVSSIYTLICALFGIAYAKRQSGSVSEARASKSE